MSDPRLSIIAAVLKEPNKPLKVYMELSSIARATFFKAKASLEAEGILSFEAGKQLSIDRDAAKRFVSEHYPGLLNIVDETP